LTTVVAELTTQAPEALVKYFKVGLGGFTTPGGPPQDYTGAKSRNTSLSAGLTDLDVVENPSTYSNLPPVVASPLIPASYSFGGGILTVTCALTTVEYGDDGTGTPPVIGEIGLFVDDANNPGSYIMVAYGTIPQYTVNSDATYTFTITP
jgi:hypothetical protein